MSKTPVFIKSTGGNCGIYAVIMALNSIGLNVNAQEIEELSKKVSYFGELYTRNQMTNFLNIIKEKHNFKYTTIEFSSESQLSDIIRQNTIAGNYILLPYYAFQGFVVQSKKPDMDRGHWMVVYDIDSNNNIDAIQSNSKAHAIKALHKVSALNVYKSNNILNNIKINWGRYHHCKINVQKNMLEENPRCGEEKCNINDKMGSKQCVYKCDLSNYCIILEN